MFVTIVDLSAFVWLSAEVSDSDLKARTPGASAFVHLVT